MIQILKKVLLKNILTKEATLEKPALKQNDIKGKSYRNSFKVEYSAALIQESRIIKDIFNIQIRFCRGAFIGRDETKDGPALDEKGKYRPEKPKGWDESYPNGPPEWANYKY